MTLKYKKKLTKKYATNRNKNRTTRRRKQRGGMNPIPVFIICYNQYTYVKSMVEQLSNYPGMTLYIIDNKSTYPPLLEYLKSIENKVKVLYQPENYGHKVYERDDIIKLGGDKYIVTDPDIILNHKLPKNFIESMVKLSDKYKTNKIGFALDIKNNIDMNRRIKVKDGRPDVNGVDQTLPEWEGQFWKERIDDPEFELYRAPIDTTFALINRKFYAKGRLDNSIRIAGDFTAVHRPWLNNYKNELKEGEHDYYMRPGNISTTIHVWNNTNQSGGNMKRVFLVKHAEYFYFKEYVESICDGDEIRIWNDEDVLPGNIFYLCVRMIPYDKIPSTCKIGFINTEQLSDPNKLAEYNSFIRDNIEIYDYSQDNIKISGKGTYMPYKENPEETIKLKSFMDVLKEFDVAIVSGGESSSRRLSCIDELRKNGITVHAVSGWGDERDKEIGKAKLLLNIHYSDTYNIYEAIRCERWRFAGMPILSEPSMSPMPEGVTECVLDEMPKKILSLKVGGKRRSYKGGSIPTFHVIIATSGRPELRGMIDSLRDELKEGDAVTILFDGKNAKQNSGYNDTWKEGFTHFTIIEQVPGLKHYGHATINKYGRHVKPVTTYVMFADDDDTYIKGSFNILRSKCIDPSTLYIARMKNTTHGNIIPPHNLSKIEINNIGKPNGIIPYHDVGKAEFGIGTYTGDFDYYNDIKDKVKKIVFLDDIIYAIGKHTENAKNANILT